MRAPLSLNAIAARAVIITAGILGFMHVFWVVFWSIRAFDISDYASSTAFLRIAWFTQTGLGGAFCVLGAFVASKAGNRAGVWTLGAYLVAQGLATGYLNSLVDMIGFSGFRPQFARLLVNLLAYSAALRAVQLFPRALQPNDLDPLIRPGALSRFIWIAVRSFIEPWRVWVLAASILSLIPLTSTELVFHIGQLTIISLVISTMVANYLIGDRETRKKIYWLLAGALILLLGRVGILTGHIVIDWLRIPDLTVFGSGLTIPAVGILRLTTWTAATVGMMICVLFAVFYKGAISPEMVIRRTAVYSAGFGLLVFTFGVFVNYIAAIVVDILMLEQTFVEAVAGTLIALTFKPLNDLLMRLADRVLPKRLSSEALEAVDNRSDLSSEQTQT